jgi:acyl-CoA reductase-like NAD-dependent aldehyde dehydrogenase
MGIEETIAGLGHLVDGKLVTTGETFGVVNPATGEVFAQCPAATPALLDEAMAAAQRALPAWAADEQLRRDTIRKMAEAIEANFGLINEVASLEKGATGSGGEAFMGAVFGKHLADAPLPIDILQDDDVKQVAVVRKPVGVVACIAPWNAPVLILCEEIFNALLVGNTVVGKPSPFTPLGTLVVANAWKDIVPPGVVNILAGDDEIGKAMVSHPATRMVAFTGSVAAGKAIAAAAAPTLKNLLMELGGNDAAIVLGDVDPKKVAPAIFGSAMGMSGQICAAVKRVYVHESIYESFVDEIAGVARETVVAPVEEGGTMGPLGTRPQYERVIELVEEALEAGGKAVTGGAPADRPGFYYPPTILTGVGAGVRVVDEEQFGPVLPIIPFSDVDWAIEQANATDYGLCGSVWTSDIALGQQLAARLESGTASVNNHIEVSPTVPFGGVKSSGVGRSCGQVGLDSFAELQTRITYKDPAKV